jgi:hypothetical protein
MQRGVALVRVLSFQVTNEVFVLRVELEQFVYGVREDNWVLDETVQVQRYFLSY